ncbi:putative vitellogenin receptor [Sitodiplosis mosellana]|uniref:putative vitellogenin receptor n=1 Tax=Sitodiplosis mosellana TaxID=263140 RepID=UPI002444A3D3|nr:putative vitellogenin receptor [Sitodiplosis mosellana]
MHVEHPVTSPTPMNMELLAITPLTVSQHPCAQYGFNGGCSHVCVAMGKTTHACLCTPGTVFGDAKNTTCVPVEMCNFRCGSGECITDAERCDGVKNCQDSSDEDSCKEKKKFVTCAPNEFTCLDGTKCIDRKMRCDQNYDCGDNSDEKDCKDYDKETECHQNQFLCLNGACIDSNQLCDGFKDCATGEDELETTCRQSESRSCNAEEFKCSNNQCIPTAWVCDGALDCSNDEENCCKNGKKSS